MTDLHAQHDRTVIAALAARPDDLTSAETDAARTLVAACAACADLLAELVAIQVAIPHAATPVRPRSFQLTPDDARRLGRGGWRRFLATVGSSRDQVTRPLALGLTTLGVAALMVAALPGAMGGGGMAATLGEDQRLEQPAPAAGGAVPELHSMAATAGPDTLGNPDTQGLEEGSPDAGRQSDTGTDPSTELKAAIRDDATGLSTLIVLGGVLIILGVGLFGLRWSARRFGDG